MMLLGVIALSACNRTAVSEDRVREIARDAIDSQAQKSAVRIDELERELASLRSDWRITNSLAVLTSKSVDRLRGTVNGNAVAANANTLKDMTSRGACGTRTVYPERVPGVITPVMRLENIPCTEKDLSTNR